MRRFLASEVSGGKPGKSAILYRMSSHIHEYKTGLAAKNALELLNRDYVTIKGERRLSLVRTQLYQNFKGLNTEPLNGT